MDNPHAGHRKRLRERFIKNGLDNFEKHNVLELLLFNSVPRQDTNELAHRLMEEFGSLSGVFDAPVEELMKLDGIGENSAVLIKLIPAISKVYLDDKNTIGTLVRSTDESINFLLPKFIGETTELIYLLCLDNKSKVLGCPLMCRGDISSVNFTPRSVVEAAIKLGATSVILAHNHPRGLALPSKDDINTTNQLITTLTSVNIRFLDHIIVAGDEAVSLADSGLFYKK
ncbi:MAG: DNA repair protein RadC [Hydrogenoanaerobacterium sp.]